MTSALLYITYFLSEGNKKPKNRTRSEALTYYTFYYYYYH